MKIRALLFLIFINIAVCFNTPLKAEEGLGHECGLALVRLRKPISYYHQKYGDTAWAINKICALIEEQRNRGQDGAGMAVMKFDMPPGESYLRRMRIAGANSIDELLEKIF